MPEGGILTIETANVNLDDDYAAAQADMMAGEYVMLALTDTGTGMTDDTLERVFEPFFTTKEVGSGTGLGLGMLQRKLRVDADSIYLSTNDSNGTTSPFVAAFEHDGSLRWSWRSKSQRAILKHCMMHAAGLVLLEQSSGRIGGRGKGGWWHPSKSRLKSSAGWKIP